MIDLNEMSKKALEASKTGEATVSVSKGVYRDPDTDEQHTYFSVSVIIDGIATNNNNFNDALAEWKDRRESEMADKVKAAKKLLAREGA